MTSKLIAHRLEVPNLEELDSANNLDVLGRSPQVLIAENPMKELQQLWANKYVILGHC